MGKELAKDASLAAAESILRGLMPELLKRIDGLHKELREFRSEVTERFEKVDHRFERMEHRLGKMDQRLELLPHELTGELDDRTSMLRDVINELGLRIKGVETKVDVYSDLIRERNSVIHKWLERLIRVELAQSSRRRKAS